MVTTVLGKVAITPKGEWNSATAYEKLDVVSYNGSSYLSVRTVPAATPLSNTNYWLLLAQKGDTGNGVASIEKTGTSGLTDTYTITYTDGSTSTFTVINGEAATVVLGTVSTGEEGTAVVITNSGDEHNAVLNFTIPRGNTGNGIQGIELTGTSGGVKTYTITFTDGNTFSFDVTDGEVTEERLAEALADYALINGYYEDLVAGGSEQLLSSVYEEDKVPYLFRTSGGSIDIGDREDDTIVGGTVAWNQLMNGIATTTTDGITTAYDSETHEISITNDSRTTNYSTGSTRSSVVNPTTKNHVYVLVSSKEITGVTFTLVGSGDSGVGFVLKPSMDNVAISLRILYTYDFVNAHPIGNVEKFKVNIFDVTQMFGSTIADYIYSLEQATAGAGVAWFKKLFPKPYYEYDADSLKHVEGLSAHKMRGFNAWDEEWELGSIDSNGNPTTGTTSIRSKNYIPVIPNAVYYFRIGTSSQTNPFFYDADKNFIGRLGTYLRNNTFTVPANASFMKIGMPAEYGNTYKNDICINLHWDGERDGEYEPYKENVYPLDDSLTLRGIFELDENNNLRCKGDVYHSDGTVDRNFGIATLNGNQGIAWNVLSTSDSNMKAFYISRSEWATRFGTAPQKTAAGGTLNALSNKLPVYSQRIYTSITAPGIYGWTDNSVALLIVPASGVTTGSEFNTWLQSNPLSIVYDVETPTTEQAEPYINPQIVDNWGTEEYVSTGIVPVGHVTKYMPDLKSKLEVAPDSPDGDGDYILRQTNGQNSYVPLLKELPAAPSEDGTYNLKLTIANGTATLAWEAE